MLHPNFLQLVTAVVGCCFPQLTDQQSLAEAIILPALVFYLYQLAMRMLDRERAEVPELHLLADTRFPFLKAITISCTNADWRL